MKKRPEKNVIRIFDLAGAFAEDKDAARRIRVESILPCLQKGEAVALNFGKVAVATQSFIHALISEVLRSSGEKALDLLEFKACNPTVKSVILTVVEYSLAQRQSKAAV